MDIHNIALVRATEHIPFDGKVKPVGQSISFSKNNEIYQYPSVIGDFLEREGKVPNFDQIKEKMIEDGEISKDSDFGEIFSKCSTKCVEVKKEIKKDYLPYYCNYNSMVLFSINGLVPDDGENGGFTGTVFSSKNCAIIEGLEEHIDEVISLNPTDTAIKGTVNLSPNAVILISQQKYNSLTNEQKERLNNLSCEVKIFEGNLKQAVNNVLENSERYTAEELTLSREQIKPSETRDDVMNTLNQIAEERNLSQAYHLSVLLHKTNMEGKLEDVKEEAENMGTLSKYYMDEFYQYIFSKMDIDKDLQYDLIHFKNAKPYLEEFCKKIKEYGIDEYRELVTKYNTGLEELKEENKLPTPETILNSINKGETISIADLVEEHYTGNKINFKLEDKQEINDDVKSLDSDERI